MASVSPFPSFPSRPGSWSWSAKRRGSKNTRGKAATLAKTRGTIRDGREEMPRRGMEGMSKATEWIFTSYLWLPSSRDLLFQLHYRSLRGGRGDVWCNAKDAVLPFSRVRPSPPPPWTPSPPGTNFLPSPSPADGERIAFNKLETNSGDKTTSGLARLSSSLSI